MRKLNSRSLGPLKANKERLEEVRAEIEGLQERRLQRRASSLAGQIRIGVISDNIDEALVNQERNLDDLKRLALAK